jgi:tRNA threonylcarbamoyladenosine biosynthesis protein TsaB
MPLRVLAIDTSAEITSVAVCDGAQLLAEDDEKASDKHAEILLPRLQHCLERAGVRLADIDLLAVGIGPGSFTGVRVGIATAKGLALALQKPLCPVVSLAALALAASEAAADPDARLAPCLDAFKGEVFAALYRRAEAGVSATLAPLHALPGDASVQLATALAGASVVLFGAGYRRYESAFADLSPRARVLPEAFDAPRARHIAQLALAAFARGEIPALSKVLPLYVRDSDAQLPKQPLRIG